METNLDKALNKYAHLEMALTMETKVEIALNNEIHGQADQKCIVETAQPHTTKRKSKFVETAKTRETKDAAHACAKPARFGHLNTREKGHSLFRAQV